MRQVTCISIIPVLYLLIRTIVCQSSCVRQGPTIGEMVIKLYDLPTNTQTQTNDISYAVEVLGA